ncbi:MAG: O-antigen ligase family protein [Aquabacterium sp.]|nr:O-antigen ligase family protein [Aquabacterium sp.]
MVALLACCAGMGTALGALPLTLALPVVVVLAAPWLLLGIGAVPLPTGWEGTRLYWAFVGIFAVYFVWPQGAFIAGLKLPVKHPQKIAFLLLFALWLSAVMKMPHLRQRFMARMRIARPVVWAMALFSIFGLLSCWVSIAPLFSMYRWAQETIWVVSIFYIVLSLPKSLRQVHAAIAALSVAAVLNALFAIPETLRRKNLFERFNNLDAVDPITAQAILEAKFRGGGYRAQASFDHPLLFAEFMLVMAPLACIALGFAYRRWRPVVILVPIYLFGVLSTRSRVTVVVAGVAVLFALAFWFVHLMRQNHRSLMPVIQTVLAIPVMLAMLLVAGLAGSELVAGRNTDEFLSSLARVEMLRESWPLILAQPWLGYGHGAGGFVLGFADSSGMMTLDNYFLGVVLDNGVLALVALLTALLLAFGRSVRMAASSDPQLRRLGLACATSLLSILLIKLVLGTGLNNGLMYFLMALPYVVSDLVQSQAAGNGVPGKPARADDALLHHTQGG